MIGLTIFFALLLFSSTQAGRHNPHHRQLAQVQLSDDVELIDSNEPKSLEIIDVRSDLDHPSRLTRFSSELHRSHHPHHLHTAKLVKVSAHHLDDDDHHHSFLSRQITHRPSRPHGPRPLKPGSHVYYNQDRPEAPDSEVIHMPQVPLTLNEEANLSEREMLELLRDADLKLSHHDHHLREPYTDIHLGAQDVVGDGIMIGHKIYTSDPLLLAALTSNDPESHDHHHNHRHQKFVTHSRLATHPGFVVAPKFMTSVRAVPLHRPTLVAPASVIALPSKNMQAIATASKSFSG